MSTTFGNDLFSIEYELNTNEEIGEGWLRLYINGQDICSYKNNNTIYPYSWNLFCIVEWLCENLEYILGYDPFPLPVQGENILALIHEADQFESDNDMEEYLWYSAKSEWCFKHNWFSSREGSVLSHIYFRRIENNIEICWDNEFWKDSDIEFQAVKGCILINKDNFKKVITEFLRHFLDEVIDLTADNGQRERIECLSKRLKLLENIL